jgi:hypothetical protein
MCVLIAIPMFQKKLRRVVACYPHVLLHLGLILGHVATYALVPRFKYNVVHWSAARFVLSLNKARTVFGRFITLNCNLESRLIYQASL